MYTGKGMQWGLYIARDKKVYNKEAYTDTVLWNDARVNKDTIYKTELKPNDTTILGYPCDRVTFTCKFGTQVYYFNKGFWVDPALFVDYKFVNYYDYLKIAKSLALKEVFIYEGFTVEITATTIKQGPVDDALFVLPDGALLKENMVKF
ncbi:MAG: hypothetical protein ACXVB0_20455 [Mucilaginibacter sp.]